MVHLSENEKKNHEAYCLRSSSEMSSGSRLDLILSQNLSSCSSDNWSCHQQMQEMLTMQLILVACGCWWINSHSCFKFLVLQCLDSLLANPEIAHNLQHCWIWCVTTSRPLSALCDDCREEKRLLSAHECKSSVEDTTKQWMTVMPCLARTNITSHSAENGSSKCNKKEVKEFRPTNNFALGYLNIKTTTTTTETFSKHQSVTMICWTPEMRQFWELVLTWPSRDDNAFLNWFQEWHTGHPDKAHNWWNHTVFLNEWFHAGSQSRMGELIAHKLKHSASMMNALIESDSVLWADFYCRFFKLWCDGEKWHLPWTKLAAIPYYDVIVTNGSLV